MDKPTKTHNTRSAAMRVARLLGCEGAHKVGNGWRPCSSPEALKVLITKGPEAYEAHEKRQKTKPTRFIVNGEPTPKKKRRVKKVWENLGERGVLSIQGGGPGITSGKDANHSGIVAVLLPTKESIEPYLQEGGLPFEEMHLTVAYLGDTDKVTPFLKEDMVSWAYALSQTHGPIRASVTGVAGLGNDDPQAVVILLENSTLLDIREDFDQGLRAECMDRTHPGFIPHSTLGYGIPIDKIKPDKDIVFDRVGIWWGKERIELPLQSISVN